jgi:hypothetical protein
MARLRAATWPRGALCAVIQVVRAGMTLCLNGAWGCFLSPTFRLTKLTHE